MENIEWILNREIDGLSYSCVEEDLNNYGRDRTTIKEPKPLLITFPNSTEQVKDIVKFANKYKIGIVPSGGRTGLSGGAVANNGEIVVSLEKMNKITKFNSINRMVELEAGVTIERIIKFSNDKGLHYPINFAPRSHMQIGGNISTNAGGIKVIRYGLTRNWVNAITFVTGKGDILEINKGGLIKNASGYDIKHLIIGGEGILGIITKAVVQLTDKPNHLNVWLLSISDIDHVLVLLERFREKFNISSFEFISREALDYSCRYLGLERPLKGDSPFFILVEFEDTSNKNKKNIIKSLKKDNILQDYIEAKNKSDYDRIWLYREKISESLNSLKPYKNDISVLPSDIPSFIKELNDKICSKYKHFQILWFGHIGDGNLHINIIKPKSMNMDIFYKKSNKISIEVSELVKKYNGSISAEHGIGILKKDYLKYSKSKLEIEYMKHIKTIFDPNNIMNPGKIF